VVGFIVVAAVETAHRWDPEERGCTSSAMFCDFRVVGCGLALPSASRFCGRAVFATISLEMSLQAVIEMIE
jgi:hypothetical protein